MEIPTLPISPRRFDFGIIYAHIITIQITTAGGALCRTIGPDGCNHFGRHQQDFLYECGGPLFFLFFQAVGWIAESLVFNDLQAILFDNPVYSMNRGVPIPFNLNPFGLDIRLWNQSSYLWLSKERIENFQTFCPKLIWHCISLFQKCLDIPSIQNNEKKSRKKSILFYGSYRLREFDISYCNKWKFVY